MADIRKLIENNPILEALNKLSINTVAGTGLPSYDEVITKGIRHRQYLNQLKQITQPRYARRTGLTNAELFKTATEGIRDLFGGHQHELLEMPSDSRNIYYRAKELVNRMYTGEFSRSRIPGYAHYAHPKYYREILDEAITSILDIGDESSISHDISRNKVIGGSLNNLFKEVGLDVDFEQADIDNAKRILMEYGKFEYGPTGKLIYEPGITEILPHMPYYPFGEVSIAEQQEYMHRYLPREYQHTPRPIDPYVQDLLSGQTEKFDTIASRVNRDLRKRFGSRVTPLDRVSQYAVRPKAVLGKISREALMSSDVTVNGRQFRIIGTDPTGFRLRQQSTADTYIEFNSIDEMLKSAYSSRPIKASDEILKQYIDDISKSAMDTVGITNLAAESFSDVSLRNADREISALFAKAITNYKRSPKAMAELKASRRLFDKAINMIDLDTAQDVLTKVGQHNINWLARDAMIEHMTWMIPDLVGMASEDLEERASDIAFQLNAALIQTVKDIKDYRRKKVASQEDIERIPQEDIERILIENFRKSSVTDIYGNTDVSKQVKAGISKIRRILGSDSAKTEDIVRYIANAPENALLMDHNIATLHKLFKTDPAGLESIVSNVWNVEHRTVSLQQPAFTTKEGNVVTYQQLIENRGSYGSGSLYADESRLLRRTRIESKTRARLFREAAEKVIGPKPVRSDSLRGKALKSARKEWNKKAKSLNVSISDADVVNRIIRDVNIKTAEKSLEADEVGSYLPNMQISTRAKMVNGKLRIYTNDVRMAQNLGAELMVNGEPVAYSAVTNAWITRSGKVLSGGYGPEVTLGADLVLAGRTNEQAAKIMRALRNNETLYKNLDIPTYNISRIGTEYANITRDLSLAKRIASGAKFWSVDFETSGLPSSRQIKGRIKPGEPIDLVDVLEASFQRHKLGSDSVIDKTYRFDVSNAVASRVEAAIHRYLPGFKRTNVLDPGVAEFVHNAAIMAGDKDTAELFSNTILKYNDFFKWVESKQGARNRILADRLIQKINADKDAIVVAHHAAGAEIPWSKLIGGTGLDPSKVVDTETIAKFAMPGGFIGESGKKGFSLQAIMSHFGMGKEAHLAAADAAANANVLSRILPLALKNAEGLEQIRPGSYFIRHTGRNLGGRGAMRYLGTEAVEMVTKRAFNGETAEDIVEHVFAAHFQRLDTGQIVSFTGESLGEIQHIISSKMIPSNRTAALNADKIFLEDSVRREIEGVLSSPVRAHRFKNEMLLLQKVAQDNGIKVGELSATHLEGINNNIAEGLTQRRLNIVKEMESWYNNVYMPAHSEIIETITSAMDAGYISTKEAYKIQRSYYNEYKAQLGDAIPKITIPSNELQPWQRSLSFEYGKRKYSISLASLQDAERSINNIVRGMSSSSKGVTNAELQRLNESQALQEIQKVLISKYESLQQVLDPTDLSPTATSLAERLIGVPNSSIPDLTFEAPGILPVENDILDMNARLAAEKKVMDQLGALLGKNSDLAMQDLSRIREIRNTFQYEEQVDAIDNFIKKERKWFKEVDDVLNASSVTAREGAEKTMLGSMFSNIDDWFKNGPLKGKGKGIAITAGLVGAGYIFSNFMSNDPLPMDERPQHDTSPGSDGKYSGNVQTDTGERTVRLQSDGSGYQGYRFNVNASNVDPRLDQSALSALINEAFASATPVDVRLNINNTDNTNKLDRSWYQRVVANAIS